MTERHARAARLLLCSLAGIAPACGPALAQSETEKRSIWSIQSENDYISTLPRGSDKFYTNGIRLGWTSGVGQVPQTAADLGAFVFGDGTTRVSIDLHHQIYTPANTERVNPNPRDHPVAAYLGGTVAVIQDVGNSRGIVALSLGVVGPLALGRQVQNGFHELIGDRINKGWGGQLPNEPVVQVVAEKTWRVALADFAGVETDMLPSATLGAGTMRNYVQTGAVLRIGQGLANDFGVARIRPGLTGGDAFGARQELTWYIFAGVDGQVVARDTLLNGALFQSSAHVQHNWLMAEMQAGIAVLWHGIRLSYTHTWQTASFRGQKGGLFNFGSLAASVRF